MNYYKRNSQRTDKKGNWPQTWFKDKTCKYCETTFTPTGPGNLYCSVPCEQDGYTNSYLKRTYGVTLKWYKEQYKNQKGLCAICNQEGFLMDPNRHRTKLVVDHNHTTKEVRGLLCHNCNRGIGLLQEDTSVLKSAINYLEGATTISKESTLK